MQSIRKRSFCGHEEATYAELYFENDNLTLTVLERDLPDTVRSLVSTREAKSLLEEIADWTKRPKAHWKARADAHQAAIESGDPLACGRAAKELTTLGQCDELRPRDKANLALSVGLLTDELSSVLRKPRAQASRLLHKALKGTAS